MPRTRTIQAAAEHPETLTLAAPVDIQAAAPGAPADAPPRFSMVAYTGGLMQLAGWFRPVAIDLAGLNLRAKMPMLVDHDNRMASRAGQGTPRVDNHRLCIDGVLTRSTDAGRMVADQAKDGMTLQASVGVGITKLESVAEDAKAQVNGQTVTGPCLIVRKGTLRETSFVAIGADESTEVQVAAKAASQGAHTMDPKFKEWVEAQGFKADDLTEQQSTSLKAAFDASQKPPETPAVVTATAPTAADVVKEVREAQVAETKRIGGVRRICASKHADIEAKAIEEGWDPTRTELEVLRAERPKAPAIISGGVDLSRQMLMATACMNARMDEGRMLKDFGEKALDAAAKFRGIGIQDFFRLVARAEGRELPIMAGKGTEFIEAAFSTLSLPGILAPVANKLLLDGFLYVESAWRQIVRVGSLKDFKVHNRYRMTDDMKFQKVGSDGKLHHGALGEQKFTIQADTAGILFSLTRQMIMNDDMSAFTDIPRRIGIGGAEALAEAVWTLILSNPSSFFSAGNKNYLTGADTVLSHDALVAAYTAFLTQTKPNGRPLGIEPRILCVPAQLRVDADRLTTSRQLIASIATTGSKSTLVPQDNQMAGKFNVASTAYLSNASFTGYSATGWYLFADPNILPAIEVGFVNGMEQPTVERAEADFSTLGVQFRGFMDFGVGMQDPRGALFIKGAA